MVLVWGNAPFHGGYSRRRSSYRESVGSVADRKIDGKFVLEDEGSEILLAPRQSFGQCKPGDLVTYRIHYNRFNEGQTSYTAEWAVQVSSHVRSVLWDDSIDTVMLLGKWYGSIFDDYLLDGFVPDENVSGSINGKNYALVQPRALLAVDRIFGSDMPAVRREFPEVEGLHPFTGVVRDNLAQRSFLLRLIAQLSR